LIKYSLDKLGWYEFERLVQSLLKQDVSLSVESWGGRHDFGRDAYCEEELHFPERQYLSSGPFLFQVKFVENANAAGADPYPALRSAVINEVRRIRLRVIEGDWQNPTHYVLLTNAIVSGEKREELKKIIGQTLAMTHIHLFLGKDICDRLDLYPELRRSFPQLLGLQDLEGLLRAAINNHLLNRSSALRTSALTLLPIFVPTKVYENAWQVLRKHHFVVLEGPPEMGKTAIADVIAVTQCSLGWHALVCQDPDEFFAVYEKTQPQVIVADDAFGRTEYDVTRGRRWERDLHRVLAVLDKEHWMIWTSRKHILERALHKLDLQENAAIFPKPAAVIVDSTRLTIREKALILYRHAKMANLPESSRNVIKAHARQIVGNPAFTPERIRRFVRDRLPSLAREFGKRLTDEKLEEDIAKAIHNPTEQMVKTFRSLPDSHKLFLATLLEAGYWASLPRLKVMYSQKYSELSDENIDDIVDELSEAFLAIRSS